MYKYKDANNLLIKKFPVLDKIYKEDEDYYVDLPYLFYEPFFTKYIIDKVNSNDFKALEEVFDFVEDMFVNSDEEIKNLIGVAVVESLSYEKDFMARYQEFEFLFGPLTLKSFEAIDWVPKGTSEK
ncbi:MAG: hypothetical protein LBI13_02555 [Streptococcaceae bacterium]|nr:hypothetical protein [Streptococcaceae bacterium]